MKHVKRFSYLLERSNESSPADQVTVTDLLDLMDAGVVSAFYVAKHAWLAGSLAVISYTVPSERLMDTVPYSFKAYRANGKVDEFEVLNLHRNSDTRRVWNDASRKLKELGIELVTFHNLPSHVALVSSIGDNLFLTDDDLNVKDFLIEIYREVEQFGSKPPSSVK